MSSTPTVPSTVPGDASPVVDRGFVVLTEHWLHACPVIACWTESERDEDRRPAIFRTEDEAVAAGVDTGDAWAYAVPVVLLADATLVIPSWDLRWSVADVVALATETAVARTGYVVLQRCVCGDPMCQAGTIAQWDALGAPSVFLHRADAEDNARPAVLFHGGSGESRTFARDAEWVTPVSVLWNGTFILSEEGVQWTEDEIAAQLDDERGADGDDDDEDDDEDVGDDEDWGDDEDREGEDVDDEEEARFAELQAQLDHPPVQDPALDLLRDLRRNRHRLN